MTRMELCAELMWTRNELAKEKQLNKDLKGANQALIEAGDGPLPTTYHGKTVAAARNSL